MSVYRSNQPALHAEPTFHLVGSALSNLLLFAGAGLLLAIARKFWPRLGARLMAGFVAFWAVLPALIIAGPRIYPAAWVIVAAGVGSLATTFLGRPTNAWRRRLILSMPALLGSVLVLAAAVFGGSWLKTWREDSRPLPPPDAPNVLLLVLDTVRADHLSLYGYERPTTPVLERLAERGVRFDEARATAPWTLPSHASLFTGRWPHQLGVEWLTPLRGSFPTLSEYLASRGYATAGFVANTLYCSYETGLNRGFTHYDDYVLEKLIPLRTAEHVEAACCSSYRIWACSWAELSMSARSARCKNPGSRLCSSWTAAKTPGQFIANLLIGCRDVDSRRDPFSHS